MMSARRLGLVEMGVCGTAGILFLVVLWVSFAAAPGTYTENLRGVLRVLIAASALQLVAVVGHVAVATAQHRGLRKVARVSAMIASRRASDGVTEQIVTAAANLEAAARALHGLIATERETAQLLNTIADHLGIEVVPGVPPPGHDLQPTDYQTC